MIHEGQTIDVLAPLLAARVHRVRDIGPPADEIVLVVDRRATYEVKPRGIADDIELLPALRVGIERPDLVDRRRVLGEPGTQHGRGGVVGGQ